MNLKARLKAFYDRLFPTALEARLIQVLGGTTITIGAFRKFDRPMTIIVSRGKLLRSQRFRRAALNGMGLLANDIQWGIRIMGASYERDVISAYAVDEELERQGWRLAYVRVQDLWQRPARVRQDLLKFMA